MSDASNISGQLAGDPCLQNDNPLDIPLRLYGTANDSIVDGVGLRAAVFVQGCPHHCPGCHNPESHPYEGGTLTTVDAIVKGIAKNKLVQGVTLSGGEPFDQACACAAIGAECKQRLKLNVWTYTGYLLEDLMRIAEGEQEPSGNLDPAGVKALLEITDVLVDGPFIQSLKSYELKWKGSSNQRVIDMNATRRAGRVVLWQSWDDFPTKPENW